MSTKREQNLKKLLHVKGTDKGKNKILMRQNTVLSEVPGLFLHEIQQER
jgi:hypothetical protein